MSEFHQNIPEIVQNLLTNAKVGGNINIETVQQIAQQIVINLASNPENKKLNTLMIATSFLNLFRQESNEFKKALLLQLFNLIKYNEDLPTEFREKANSSYAEFESLEPEQFQDLFTPSGKYQHLKQKIGWFIAGTTTGSAITGSIVKVVMDGKEAENSPEIPVIDLPIEDTSVSGSVLDDKTSIELESDKNLSNSSSSKVNQPNKRLFSSEEDPYCSFSHESSSNTNHHQSYTSRENMRYVPQRGQIVIGEHNAGHFVLSHKELEDYEIMKIFAPKIAEKTWDLPEIEPDLLSDLPGIQDGEQLVSLQETEEIIKNLSDLGEGLNLVSLDSLNLGEILDGAEIFDNFLNS